MLILLYGEDTFRLQRKLNEIVKEYQTKNKSRLNLTIFQADGLDFKKFKNTAEAVSMFDEKKLIILKNVFREKYLSELFLDYFKKNKLKQNQDIVALIYEQGKISLPSLKKKVSMYEEFKPLQGIDLINWTKNEILKNNGKIDNAALDKLISYAKGNLWRLSNEINKLINYKNTELITRQDVDFLVKHETDNNIFQTLDALAKRDKKIAFRLLHSHLEQGENEIYLLSMLSYQMRNLLKLKDLTEKNTPFNLLAKKSQLHPFVVKKSLNVLRNFTKQELKKIYQNLADIDFKLKTGRISRKTALDLIVMQI